MALNKSTKLKKSKFVLTIGDDGAILVRMRGNVLDSRTFAKHTNPSDIQKFKDVLKDEPNAPIYILIDLIDQSYTQHSLPGVSSLSIGKLVKKRLDREHPSDDLKASILLNRSKTGRGDWNFLFVSCPIASPLTDWLNIIFELSNPLAGIYLFPIETANVIQKLSNLLSLEVTKSKIEYSEENPKWQILICHNKVSGFRQVAFKNGKLVFTRLITSTMGESPDFVVGNIEQEIQNSIEYLKRLSLRDEDQYDLYFIVASDIKTRLVKVKFKAANTYAFTPYELAEKLGLARAANPDDKFADVVTSGYFTQVKPIQGFSTASISQLLMMETLNKYLHIPGILLIPLLLTTLATTQNEILNIRKDIQYAENERNLINERWKQFQLKNGAGFNVEEATRIIDVTSVYKLLTASNASPIEALINFNHAKGNNVIVKKVEWKLKDDSVRGAPPVPTPPGAPPAPQVASIDFNVDFYNKGQSYQELFDSFDSFIKGLENSFKKHTISYSRITEKISFNETNKVIPVQITVEGPKP
jgi:hypothetical protein